MLLIAGKPNNINTGANTSSANSSRSDLISPFMHIVQKCLPFCKVHLYVSAFTTVTVETHPQMWHFWATLCLTNAFSTLLHREACCVLSGGTQMAATWSVLVGSCDSFGQDMNTHTDGDPHRVNGRWTCSLLICSDQWFTTWSSDTREVAPAELAHWPGAFGTHHFLRRVSW